MAATIKQYEKHFQSKMNEGRGELSMVLRCCCEATPSALFGNRDDLTSNVKNVPSLVTIASNYYKIKKLKRIARRYERGRARTTVGVMRAKASIACRNMSSK